MKKIILFGAVAVFALSLASCSKDYTCTCTFSSGGDPEAFVYPKSSKKNAEEACKKQQTTIQGMGAADASCSI